MGLDSRSSFAIAVLLIAPTVSAIAEAERAQAPKPSLYREQPQDPPAKTRARSDPSARAPAGQVVRGPYTSIQINTDEQGLDILGDAANEPTLAVNPNNPSHLVVGWRQFDSITSNFRQAGFSFSLDAGANWRPGDVLTPFLFRSDPVVGFDSSGRVYYESLTIEGDYGLEVRRSAVGEFWSDPVAAFGGDKNWMVLDTTGGIGDGHIYSTWQRAFGCCGNDTLTRSVTEGTSFEVPVGVPFNPGLGTMAVGPDGSLYLAGIDEEDRYCISCFVVSRSDDAQDPGVLPTFVGSELDLGGELILVRNVGPNPAGLAGQVNVATDHSSGPGHGNVYVLASVSPAGPDGPDPLDVHFARSTDRGMTWTGPIRVNDDPMGAGAWHWFGTMSVAPNGRIDVVWNDTRRSGEVNLSELFYSWSWDQGQTWAPGVPASPAFDSFLGWPQQNKLGDYSGMESDATGANLAYAATFNGGQDVYFVRLFPDCNGNGVSDVADLADETSFDCNANRVPDECEEVGDCLGVGMVPDGTGPSGVPLRLSRAPDGEVTLSWAPSCTSSDTDYEIYEGDMADFTSHEPRLCTTDGATSTTLLPSEGDRYFLVVPRNETLEGSYGSSSSGERLSGRGATCLPAGAPACLM